jgi:hypothetical protein
MNCVFAFTLCLHIMLDSPSCSFASVSLFINECLVYALSCTTERYVIVLYACHKVNRCYRDILILHIHYNSSTLCTYVFFLSCIVYFELFRAYTRHSLIKRETDAKEHEGLSNIICRHKVKETALFCCSTLTSHSHAFKRM